MSTRTMLWVVSGVIAYGALLTYVVDAITHERKRRRMPWLIRDEEDFSDWSRL